MLSRPKQVMKKEKDQKVGISLGNAEDGKGVIVVSLIQSGLAAAAGLKVWRVHVRVGPIHNPCYRDINT